MAPKTASVICTAAMVIAVTAALISVAGIAITGFYPGMVVLLLLAIITIASRVYIKKMMRRDTGATNYTAITIINILVILVVLWMSFVIVIDRLVPGCC